jgi:uncharacterized protein YidB (DUF937 family)
MSLLESLLGGALRGAGQDAAPGSAFNASSPLLQILLQMLSSGGQFGGIEGLTRQFQQAGLGQQMGSWISTGQNLPISPEQLEQVFGRGGLEQMAGQAGMNTQDFGGALAETLPQIIDRATPQGEVPQGGLDDVLASLSAMMPRS